MSSKLVKTGACLLVVAGIILSIFLVVVATLAAINYSNDLLWKKVALSGGLFLSALAVFLIAIALYRVCFDDAERIKSSETSLKLCNPPAELSFGNKATVQAPTPIPKAELKKPFSAVSSQNNLNNSSLLHNPPEHEEDELI